MRAIVSVLLVVFLGSCSERPPELVGGRLTEEQTDWYARKAVIWLEQKGGRHGFSGESLDQSSPIKKEVSPDGSTVTVSLPTRVKTNLLQAEYIFVQFEARSGKVTNSGRSKIIGERPR